MLEIIIPGAFVLGTVRVQKRTLTLSLAIHKRPVVSVSKRILGHVNSSQVPVVLAESILHAVLPLTRVRLILVEPFHCALAVSHIIHPHALVHVARNVLSYAPAELAIIDPVALVKWAPLGIVDNFTLFWV